ncbi:hypothetical protein [Rhizobium sp. BK068]|uniref:hypothetical protein n=1 Tax=Rhizobium sp. BK068 TaxID=2512130 RepID=UPI0010ED80F6|nr:hypothetical protein [Rhizobium sp. BK068]TCM64397.1 hypothetical protein EV291_1462 [Rhizobium sp. BK068]
MLPYLVAAIIVIGLPTLYVAMRYREYRKFLAGAFFVSSGMQFYFYFAKIPIPLMWTSAVQSPELSAVRGTVHFVLFLSVFRMVLPWQAPRGLGRQDAMARTSRERECKKPAAWTLVSSREGRLDWYERQRAR